MQLLHDDARMTLGLHNSDANNDTAVTQRWHNSAIGQPMFDRKIYSKCVVSLSDGKVLVPMTWLADTNSNRHYHARHEFFL